MAINRRLSIPSYARFGQFTADPSVEWEAGSVACIGTAGLKNVTTVATDWPFGIFWTNNTNTLTKATNDKVGPLDYSDATLRAVNLEHAGVIASSYVVYMTASAGSTAYTTLLSDTTDYTFVANGGSRTNGVIAAVLNGKLDSTGTGSASYTDGLIQVFYRYTLSSAEKNGFLDDEGNTIGGPGFSNTFVESTPFGQCTVAADGSLIYTDQYLTSDIAAIMAGAKLYSNTAGLLTTTAAASATQVGRVIEIPTATQPYLGILVTAR